MEKDKVKGWTATDYAFEELYDAYLSILFEYQGKEYRLSCEGKRCMIAIPVKSCGRSPIKSRFITASFLAVRFRMSSTIHTSSA